MQQLREGKSTSGATRQLVLTSKVGLRRRRRPQAMGLRFLVQPSWVPLMLTASLKSLSISRKRRKRGSTAMHQRRVKFAESTALSAPAIITRRAKLFTTDEIMTFDQLTVDSTGAFLIGELERLDPTLHEPLATVTWGRDIDLREDVTLADEVSS